MEGKVLFSSLLFPFLPIALFKQGSSRFSSLLRLSKQGKERYVLKMLLSSFFPIPSLCFYCFNFAKMAAHKIAHATYKGPSVVKEICIGFALGLFAGGLWKMHHWNEQRKTRAFYDMLEKGEIGVVVSEEE
ncbi:hypothetical protein Cni_G24769 [Canna indica]|uniref:Cytochrome c oxidase subunit 5C n=1 Tax=Canna indica TaxID=4628 RepID=A0AAQ3KVS6_9LILI|nr:hypothetical protein Cni_G24769 [Canna indica]